MKSRRAATPNTLIIAIAAVIILGGTTWAIVSWTASDEPQSTLPPELQLDNLRKQAAENPDALRETISKSFQQRDEMTPEQRREARKNMRTIFQGELDKRIEEYTNASEEDKVAVLDRQIDEFREQMKKWRAEREKRRAERDENDADGNQRDRRGRPSQTREERKAESESRNPDAMAKRFAYFATVRSRMKARGIETPGRGGSSGGRGGRGRP